MTPPKPDKKVITQSYDVDLKKYPKVNFEVNRFEAAIIQKGYNVYHHRALRCPCVNRGTGSPLPNCENCSGLGWFYIEKKLTKALMQTMGNNKKFESWSETNAGTVNITTLFDDDLTYMDKIEILDLEANFSQILFAQAYQGNVFAFTIYEPSEVVNIYQFMGSTLPLKPLFSKTQTTDWDYYVERNKIIFNPEKFRFEDDISVSVRYKHTPVYCVIDIVREIFKTNDKGCSTSCEDDKDLSFRGMPMKSVGKRLHYIWNAPNFSGNKEFDNTDYTKPGNENIIA